MSHLKERNEKNCLNCNTEVQGKYCHVCGQENIEPKESAWHLVTHFFNDITHFDGKFFNTLKYLVRRPGFVSTEYMLGKRASYLNPVRMYVFTSAIFFLIFFSLNHFDAKNVKTDVNGKDVETVKKMDSATFSAFTKKIHGKPMTRDEFAHYVDTVRKLGTFKIAPGNYKSKEEYDSLLKAGVKKHNWLERRLVYKQIELNEKYQRDGNKILASFINALEHSFPQMLFISLPLFAFMLKMLYYRRKNFYYTNHAIFSIHLYVFVFIALLLAIGLSQLKEYTGWHWIDYLLIITGAYIFYYLYKAMRNFYQQRRAKTILKFLLLLIMLWILIAILFVIFSLFSLLNI